MVAAAGNGLAMQKFLMTQWGEQGCNHLRTHPAPALHPRPVSHDLVTTCFDLVMELYCMLKQY